MSVLTQSFDDFELKMCDDAGADEGVVALLRRFSLIDSRLELVVSPSNGGISAATNRALARSTGRYVVFLDHDDELADNALQMIAAAIDAHPEADVLYSDSDKITEEGHRYAPALKPAWSPDLLCSMMYLGHVLVVRRRLIEEVGGLRSGYDGSQDHDLALRVTEAGGSVVHIPRILYHWRAGKGSAAADPLAKPWARQAGTAAVADAFRRRGDTVAIHENRRELGRYHWSRQLVHPPSVTIALVPGGPSPTRDAHPGTCWEARARQLVAAAGMTIGGVDLSSGGGHPDSGWASMASAALRAARTDLVIFIDPWLAPLSRGWASALVSFMGQPRSGAAGGCVREGSRIVHAGLVLGLENSAGPILEGLPAGRPGYQSMAIVQREVSALGAECIVVGREAAAVLEGLPSSLSPQLATAALCLLLRRAGGSAFYEPAARFQRIRPRRRVPPDGGPPPASGTDWFRREFAAELAAGDPFFHPALSLDDPYCRLRQPSTDPVFCR